MPMKDQALDRAIAEAIRFLRRAEKLRKARKASESNKPNLPREQGEVRRSSMDLTRALADLRQGR